MFIQNFLQSDKRIRIGFLMFLSVLMGYSDVSASGSSYPPKIKEKPIEIRVVVVTSFEIGKDTGDTPGELQYWVERIPLKDTISFRGGLRTLRYNPAKHILAVTIGLGSIDAAASIMALGMDPRFDLSHAYWLVAGVGGIDPADGSTGSAVWTEAVVDGDISYHVDPREVPAGWKTGYIPYHKKFPYEGPPDQTYSRSVVRLNKALVDWAYELTKNISLGNSEKLTRQRQLYATFPATQELPKVLTGDNLSSMRYWHGKYDNDWANDWVSYWTNGKGNFVTSEMEDSGTAQALEFLTRAMKADVNRLLILRTASDYTLPHAGISAVESLTGPDLYAAFIPSLESAYKVGDVIVENIVEHWKQYKTKPPVIMHR